MKNQKPVFRGKKVADRVIRGQAQGGRHQARICLPGEGSVGGCERPGSLKGKLGLGGLGGKIRTRLPFRQIEKLGGKGKGRLAGLLQGLLVGSSRAELNIFDHATGRDGKSLLIGSVEGFQILRGGFGWGEPGSIPTDDLGLDRPKEPLQADFGLSGENDRGGTQGSQKLPGAHLVQDRLVESIPREALGRKKVVGETLKELGIVITVLEEEGIAADRCEELFWLRLDSGGLGRLVLQEPDPSLDGEEAVVVVGDPAGFQGGFQEGLALGGDQVVQGECSAPDFPHLFCGGVDPVRCPVPKENKRDGNDRQEDQEEPLQFVVQKRDHGSFLACRGGRRKVQNPGMSWRWIPLWLLWLVPGWAQDQLRLKNGEVKSGTAVKFDPATQSLTFKFDQGTLSYTQADIAEVTLKERPGVAEGRKALEEGNMEQVVAKWQEPVGQYLGVDNPWVLECAGGLGQAYLALGKVADAETLYGKMRQFYSSGPAALRAEVGLAVATSGKDASGLLTKLQGLEGRLKESLRPLRADREALAEFYFARGEAYEKKGDGKKALEDYLRVSVLYPDPPSLGQRSAKKAEALRQANKDLVTD